MHVHKTHTNTTKKTQKYQNEKLTFKKIELEI
jgi:hypothetical protein